MKIVVSATSCRSLILFRKELLCGLRALGHDVMAVSADEDAETVAHLSAIGVSFARAHVARGSMALGISLRYLRRLAELFSLAQPDLVLAYTHQAILFSALAARWKAPRARIYGMVTGLGYAFTEPQSLKRQKVAWALTLFYRCTAGFFAGMIFQNQDDRRFFEDRRMIAPATRRLVVNGSGVNLETFACQDPPLGPPIFLLVARLLRDKGIVEFVRAAARVRHKLPQARFLIVGSLDANPDALTPNDIERIGGHVEYVGSVKDIRPMLSLSSVAVLPSYREGTPRFLLEAMALGRPVITTDTPGCREVVQVPGPPDECGVRSGWNGLLVPARSVESLATAMERLGGSPSLRREMGIAGRRYAEARFDVSQVAAQISDFVTCR